jgi:hypothetical protein
MSPGAEMIDEGLRANEEVQGWPTFVFMGAHWPCAYGSALDANTLIPGGFEPDDEQMMTLRYSAKATITGDQNEGQTGDSDVEPTGDSNVKPPDVGDVITAIHNGQMKEWRVAKKTATSAAWRYELMTPDK